jgi:hypothetical protein
MADVYVVTSSRTAAVLARGRGTQYLGPYFGEPTSIADAAHELSEPLAKVHYWTRRWHELGLLKVAEVVPRAGRPIRRYITIADAIEVPPELLPDTLLEAGLTRVNRELIVGLGAAAPETVYGGVLRIHKPPGHRHVSADRAQSDALTNRRADVLQSTFTAEFTAAEARQLRRELEDLRDRWLQRADRPGRGTHMVLLAISPVPPR